MKPPRSESRNFMADTQVLIVGAGPVGLTLAVDLGKRGIRCTVIEQKEAPAFLPKLERCNARTMELYRRMGISERVRTAGLPRTAPMDVFIVLSLVERPLWRLPFPSVADAETEIAGSPPPRRRGGPLSVCLAWATRPLAPGLSPWGGEPERALPAPPAGPIPLEPYQ